MSDLKNKSLVYEKAYNFAIRVVNAYQYLINQKKEFVLSKQLLKSGTSIGANITDNCVLINHKDTKSTKVSGK